MGRKTLTKDRGWEDLDGEGFHIFPSFAYTRIKNIMGPLGSRNSKAIRTKIWNDMKTWTKGVDIFQEEALGVPSKTKSLHWTCVLIFSPRTGSAQTCERFVGEKYYERGKRYKVGTAQILVPVHLKLPPAVVLTAMASKSSNGSKEILKNENANKPSATYTKYLMKGKENSTRLESTMTLSGAPKASTNPISSDLNVLVVESPDGGSENQSPQSNNIAGKTA